MAPFFFNNKDLNIITYYYIVLVSLISLSSYSGVLGMSLLNNNNNGKATTTTTTSGAAGGGGGSIATEARVLNLFRETPLLRSERLSDLMERDVYIKMDALQGSGSFKDRGMAYLCHTLKTQQNITKLISSSGGNAGLAAATVGRALQMQVHVVVPQTTKPLVITKLQILGATVQIHGENWNSADLLARQLVEQDPTSSAAYISPYDNPFLWTGHSTVIDEIYDQLPPNVDPACIIASVGGGGLLCGIFEGLQRRRTQQQSTTNINNKPVASVIAAETIGADSFAQSFVSGQLVRLNAITSIATSLGALQVTPVVLERAKQHQILLNTESAVQVSVCTDAEAVDACVQVRRERKKLDYILL